MGDAAPYLDPALSPDGTRLAVARLDSTTGRSSLWVIDTMRGVGTPLTDSASDDVAPVWGPGGRDIVFQTDRNHTLYVRRRGANPGDREETLYRSPYFMTPTDWSRDGRVLLCEAFEKAGQGNVSVLTWNGSTAGTPQSWTGGKNGRLSADGHWVAYVSSESGDDEVYVRPFPTGEGRWRISTAGGIEPRWRGDGREIFYLAPDGTMMAVEVTFGAHVAIKPAQRLFPTRLGGSTTRIGGRNQYDVSSDGRRFLLNEPVGTGAIRVIVNWPALLGH